MKSIRVCLQIALTGALLVLHAQTAIDLRSQSKSVDFSSASYTKPSKTGTSLPLTCSVGETFFKSDAAAGRNLYGCTSTNTWSLLGANVWFGGGTVNNGDCAKFDASGNLISAGAGCGAGNALTMANPFGATGSLLVSSGAGRQGVESSCGESGGILTCPNGLSSRLLSLGSTVGGKFLLYDDPVATNRLGFGLNANDLQLFVGPASNNFTFRTGGYGGTELMRVTGSGRLGIGTMTPLTELAVKSTSSADPRGILSMQYSNDTAAARLHFRKARGTEVSPATVVTGDQLGRLRFSGHDGVDFLQSGSIDVVATGTLAANRVPTYMAFSTSTDAAPSVLTEALRLTSGQVVSIPATGSADFRAAAHTMPSKSGLTSAIPGTCTVGEEYFATDATAGRNKYYCTASNTWTQMSAGAVGGAASGDLSGSYPNPTVAQVNGAAIPPSGLLKANGSRQIVQASAGTDYMGPATAVQASQMPGLNGDCTSAAGGVALTCTKANGVGFAPSATTDATNASNISSGTLSASRLPATAMQNNQSNTISGGTQDFRNAAHTMPAVTGTTASRPSVCTVGEVFFATDATAGQNQYFCTATNTWTQVNTGAASGDLSGSYPNPTVAQVNGAAIPTSGLLKANGSRQIVQASAGTDYMGPATAVQAAQMPGLNGDCTSAAGGVALTCTKANGVGFAPSATTDATNASNISSGTLSASRLPATAMQNNQSNTISGGTQDFRNAAHTMPAVTGTTASRPSVCTVGEVFFATDATAGQNQHFCTAANTWTQVNVPPVSAVQYQASAPSGSCAANTTYAVVSGGSVYVCNGAPTAAGTWQAVSGGGGTGVCMPSINNHAAIFSDASGNCSLFLYTLNTTDGDITSSTFAGPVNGKAYSFRLTQVAAGSPLGFAMPANFTGAPSILPDLAAHVQFSMAYDAASGKFTGYGSSLAASYLYGTERTDPTAVETGKMGCLFSSTYDGMFRCLNHALEASTTVRPDAGATTHQWISSIPNSGVPQRSQPGFSDLSGTATATQLPNAARDRTCTLIVGADNGLELTDADVGPQGRQCFIPAAATVVEITIAANAGTPSVLVRKNHLGSSTNLTAAAFATASSGGLACANAAGSGTGIDGATTCATALSTTALAAGDWLELASGTAGGTAKRMSISITWRIN